MKKKLSKRQAGKLLNEQGRESPLEGMQLRYEYHKGIAMDEIAKGPDGSPGKIVENLKMMHETAVDLAVYRHPRLQATTVAHSTTSDLEKLLQEIEANDRGPLAHVKSNEPDDLIDIRLDSDTAH